MFKHGLGHGSMLTLKAPERRRRCSSVFIINFKHFLSFSIVSVVDFEQENVCWEKSASATKFGFSKKNYL